MGKTPVSLNTINVGVDLPMYTPSIYFKNFNCNPSTILPLSCPYISHPYNKTDATYLSKSSNWTPMESLSWEILFNTLNIAFDACDKRYFWFTINLPLKL